MKKIVIAQSILIVILLVMTTVITLHNNNWVNIANGEAEDFKLIEADINKYDNIKIVVLTEETPLASGEISTFLWSGEIPKGVQICSMSLPYGGKSYEVTFTIRDDGIGCLPNDYPATLQLEIYGR